ncbi:hypothetical protein D3C71_1538570 [compost metagenome]
MNGGGEREDVHVCPIQIDIGPNHDILVGRLGLAEPRHVLVVVEAFAALVEVEGQRRGAIGRDHPEPFEVHAGVLEDSRLQHHTGALDAGIRREQVGVDDIAQRGQVLRSGRPAFAFRGFPYVHERRSQGFQLGEKVADGGVDVRRAQIDVGRKIDNGHECIASRCSCTQCSAVPNR